MADIDPLGSLPYRGAPAVSGNGNLILSIKGSYDNQQRRLLACFAYGTGIYITTFNFV